MARRLLMAVNLFGVEQRFAEFLQAPAFFHAAIEAGAVSGVAGRPADLVDFDQETIPVTIDADLFDLLNIPGAFAFEPEGLTRATPEDAFLQPERPA